MFHAYFSMPPPTRSTNNSLSAGLPPEDRFKINAPASALSSSGTTLSADSIADAVVRALGSSLPTIMASIQGNAPSSAASAELPSSPASSGGTSAVGVGSGSSTPSSGTLTLPAFVPTFTPMSAISNSSSARLVAPITSTSSSPSSLGSLPCSESSSLWQKTDKAFFVGPRHAPNSGEIGRQNQGGPVRGISRSAFYQSSSSGTGASNVP